VRRARTALAVLYVALLAPGPATAEHSVTEHASIGPAGGNSGFYAERHAISEDGARLFFSTPDALTTDDTDSATDLYVRAGGVTTLISKGASNSAGHVWFHGISQPTGDTAFFLTTGALVASDTDTAADLYSRQGNTTTLLSTGSAATPAAARRRSSLPRRSSSGATRTPAWTSTSAREPPPGCCPAAVRARSAAA
jgi:hypothetical protein